MSRDRCQPWTPALDSYGAAPDSPFPKLVTALSLVAIVIGTGYGVLQPDSRTLQAVVLIPVELGVLWFLVRSSPDATPRAVQLVIAATMLRVAAAIAFHPFRSVEVTFSPDAHYYDWGGRTLAESWQSGLRAPELHRHRVAYYFFFVAAHYYLLGASSLLPKITNAVFGGLTVWYAYRIGRELHGEPAGWRGANLVAFFPSLILWSTMNTRDSLCILLITVVVWHTVSLKQGFTLRSMATLIASLYVLGRLRDYMFPLMGGVVLLGLLLSELRRTPRTVLAGLVLAGVFLATYQSAHVGRSSVQRMDLETLDHSRRGGVIDTRGTTAGSAYLADVSVTTPAEAARFIPLATAYFLFSPFPWQVRNPRHALPLPEMFYLYALLPFMLGAVAVGLRRRFSVAVVPLLAIGILSVSYSLYSSNFGTAYRHRAQVMPLILTFAGMGLTLREQRRQQRLAATEDVLSSAWPPAATGTPLPPKGERLA